MNMKIIQVLIMFFLSLLMGASAQAQEKICFWDSPQYGGNSFDDVYFLALKKYGETQFAIEKIEVNGCIPHFYPMYFILLL